MSPTSTLPADPCGEASDRVVRRTDLADFGLHHQRDVLADLSAVAAQQREFSTQPGEAVARRGPGGRRQQQPQRIGEALSDLVGRLGLVGEAGAIAAEAAELKHRRIEKDQPQMTATAGQRVEPLCGLPAERRQRHRLQSDPTGDDRVAMLVHQPDERGAGSIDGVEQAPTGLLALHRQGRVDDVLVTGPEIQVPGGLGVGRRQLFGQRPQERCGD